LQDKLDQLTDEYRDLEAQLANPEVASDPDSLRRLSQRLHELRPIVEAHRHYQETALAIAEAESILAESDDAEFRALAQEELSTNRQRMDALTDELKKLLTPKDPNDEKNAVLEIRAGTGGEEAALLAAGLYRRYLLYAEQYGWRIDEADRNETGLGGVKEVVAVIEGRGAYSRLKFESGVHRVQRIPETESGGRIHTSACTVAVLPEAEDVELDVDPNDLRIDVFRSSGPGGQSVNTTDSAVRITHVPSGVVVSCQDEKSQHKNKAKAMRILRARLQEQLEREAHAERAAERRDMVGSGDRSERIRTYNFPQNRVTDHRINLTLHKLDRVLEGDLDELVDALVGAEAAARMAADGEAS